jgi:hypothetical protein
MTPVPGRRGRKPYFHNGEEVFKPLVVGYALERFRVLRDPAAVCVEVYHNPAFKRFDFKRKVFVPCRIRVKTVLKWLYQAGLIKPGISLVQRVFRRIPIKVGAERGTEREKEVYGNKELGFRRFLAVAVDVLGLSYEDAAVYWMRLNSPD